METLHVHVSRRDTQGHVTSSLTHKHRLVNCRRSQKIVVGKKKHILAQTHAQKGKLHVSSVTKRNLTKGNEEIVMRKYNKVDQAARL